MGEVSGPMDHHQDLLDHHPLMLDLLQARTLMRRISMMRMKLSERRKGDPVNPKNQKLPKSLKHQKNPNLKDNTTVRRRRSQAPCARTTSRGLRCPWRACIEAKRPRTRSRRMATSRTTFLRPQSRNSTR